MSTNNRSLRVTGLVLTLGTIAPIAGCHTGGPVRNAPMPQGPSAAPAHHIALGQYPKSVVMVAFSPDGKTLATLDMSDTIRLWNVPNWKEKRAIRVSNKSNCIAFSSNSRSLVVGASSNTLDFWSATTGKLERRMPLKSSFTASVAFSPEGHLLAVGGTLADTTILNVASGKAIATLQDDRSTTALSFSRVGHRLARGSFKNTVDLWDTKTWRPIHHMKGEPSMVNAIEAVAWSADGRWLVSGDAAGNAILWNALSGQRVRNLPTHDGATQSVAWFPQGTVIATAGDQTIHLWNMPDQRWEQTLRGACETPYSLAISPDGTMLAAGGTGKSIDIWTFR